MYLLCILTLTRHRHGAATFAALEAGWHTLKARLGTQERRLRGVVRENLATFLRSAARLERFARALERLARGADDGAAGPPASALARAARTRVERHFGSLLDEVAAGRDAASALAALRACGPLLDLRRRVAAADAAGRTDDAAALRDRAAALERATRDLGTRADGSAVAHLIHRAAEAAGET